MKSSAVGIPPLPYEFAQRAEERGACHSPGLHWTPYHFTFATGLGSRGPCVHAMQEEPLDQGNKEATQLSRRATEHLWLARCFILL